MEYNKCKEILFWVISR